MVYWCHMGPGPCDIQLKDAASVEHRPAYIQCIYIYIYSILVSDVYRRFFNMQQGMDISLFWDSMFDLLRMVVWLLEDKFTLLRCRL